MKGKFPAYYVPIALIFCWIMDILPFLVPSLNTIEPKILGFPFVSVYSLFWVFMTILISIFATSNIWDNFDSGEDTKEDESI